MGPEDRLCQLAYAFGGKEVESLFKPPVPITIDAMAVTHITNKMVAGAEVFADSVIKKELQGILGGGAVLVAHNASFDILMLKREGVAVEQCIDTYKIAHHLDTAGVIPRHGLQYLRYYHDLDVADALAHSALGDVRVLVKLFDLYFAQMLVSFGDEEAVLREMITLSAHPVLFKKFTFGKYIGQEVKRVVADDASYCTWLFNQKVMARERGEEDDENWIYTLDYYLNPKKERVLF